MATPTPIFPAAVATDSQLMVANNLIQTRLRVGIDAVNTILFVDSTAGFTANMLVSIDKEILAIASVISAPNPSLVVSASGRGFDGTTAAAHSAGAKVAVYIDAWHHNVLSAEVKAIEAFLGPNGQNIGSAAYFIVSKQYDFAPLQPGGALAPGNNSITLSPVPRGVNGSDQNHYLYISGGTGNAEPVLITGGSAVSGASSGTVIVNCANAHTGAWTIKSATAGIQEAVNTLPNGGKIYIPSGTHLTYAPVRVSIGGLHLEGFGQQSTLVNFQDTGNLNAFEFVSTSLAQFNSLRELWIGCPNSGNVATKSGGSVIVLNKQGYFYLNNVAIFYPVTGVNALNSGYLLDNLTINEPKPTVGIGVYNDGSNAFDTVIRHLCIDGSQPYEAGIKIFSCGALYIDRCDIIHAQHDLYINPTNGAMCFDVDVTDCYFDTAYGNGVSILATNNGKVYRSRFMNCWASSAQQEGFVISTTTGGIVNGVSIHYLQAFFNGRQGINLSGAGISDIDIRDCLIAGNSVSSSGQYDGIAIGPDISGVRVVNNVSSGQYADANTTHLHGLAIYAGAGDNFLIMGNDFTGNASPYMDLTTGLQKIVTGNLGIDDVSPPVFASAASIAPGATSFIQITGTTTITTMTGGWLGRQITLFKTDAGSVTVGGGGNIPGTHTLAQNASLIFTFNGSSWV